MVDVEVKLYGRELDFDPAHPPEVDESSPREAMPVADNVLTIWLYDFLANATSPEIVGPFSSLLTSSPYAAPALSLGETSALEEISAAIRKKHGIIRAQDLQYNWWVKIMENGIFPTTGKADEDGNRYWQDVIPASGADLSPEEALPAI